MTTLDSHELRAARGIRAGSHAIIDTGEGPRTVLIAFPGAYAAGDEEAVPADSPLGRALLGARVGDRVRFRAAAGPRMARVIAIQR